MSLQDYNERLETLKNGPSEHKQPIKSIKYIVESMVLYQNNFDTLVNMYNELKSESSVTSPHKEVLFDLDSTITITQEDMLNEKCENTAFVINNNDTAHIDYVFIDLLQVLIFNQREYHTKVVSIDCLKDDILEQMKDCIDLALTIVTALYDIQYLFQKLVAIDSKYKMPTITLYALPCFKN